MILRRTTIGMQIMDCTIMVSSTASFTSPLKIRQYLWGVKRQAMVIVVVQNTYVSVKYYLLLLESSLDLWVR